MIALRVLVIAALSLAAATHARAQDSVARYTVTFDASWSLATHPFATPPNPHFSQLVGGTHDAGVVFWQEGGLASQAIEDMAELGSPFGVQAQIQAAIALGRAHFAAIGAGVGSPGSGRVQLEATLAHPLATVVSMVAPSPDWFVGVSGVPLFANGEWVDALIVELHAYDAGTDTGPQFESPDADEQPQSPIVELGYPFVSTPPLGTFTFVRLANDFACDDGLDDDGDGLVDFPADPGCEAFDDDSERGAALPCDDGIDNDGDGNTDLADAGCNNPRWPTESPQCSDGINNDPGTDAGIDFDGGASQNGGVALAASDPQCSTPSQRSESPSACGIGFEIAPLLAGIGYAMRRRSRRRGSRE